MSKKKTKPTSTATQQAPPDKNTVFENLYFGFFLILPIVFSTKTVDPVLVPRQLLLSVFMLVVGFLILSRISAKKIEADFSFLKLNIIIAAGIFLLAILVSFFQAIAVSESWYIFSKIFIELIFFILTTFLIINRQLRLKVLLNAVFAMAAIALLIALYQLLTSNLTEGDFSKNTYTIKSSMANKNLFASLIFLAIPFLLILALQKNSWKRTSLALLIISGILLWVIQARAVLVALVIAGLIYAFFAFRYKLVRLTQKTTRNALIAGIICLAAMVFLTWSYRDAFSHLFYSESVYERIGLWQNTGSMIAEHPVSGVGAGNWQIWFPKNGLDKFEVDFVKDGLITFQRPHNDFLWVFSETGIFGILAYLLIFACAGFYLVKLIRRSENSDDKIIYAILFSAVIGYMAIAAMDFPLERIEHQLVLYLIFSIATTHYFLLKPKPEHKRRTVLPVFIALAGAFFSLIVAGYRNSSERHINRLLNAHHNGDWNTMIAEVDEATNPFCEMDLTSQPLAWYKGVALFSLNDIPGAKYQFEQAEKIHPYNLHVMNNLGSCYEKTGDHANAIRYYKKALHYSDHFEESRLNLSAVYFNMKQYEQAFQTIDACDTATTDPKYATFLPAILGKKIELLQKEVSDSVKRQQLATLQNSPELLQKAYFSARRQQKNFVNFLLENK